MRSGLLSRALQSVWDQTHLPDAVTVALDHYRQGAAVTRNRALHMAQTEWIVFLDSDDILYPNYLERLFDHQVATGADVVWPWYDVKGSSDPLAVHFGRQWNPDEPHQFPITTLVRREYAIMVGGFPEDFRAGEVCLGEDFPFWVSLSNAGAAFAHLPERLWEWNHVPEGGNTSGLGTRW